MAAILLGSGTYGKVFQNDEGYAEKHFFQEENALLHQTTIREFAAFGLIGGHPWQTTRLLKCKKICFRDSAPPLLLADLYPYTLYQIMKEHNEFLSFEIIRKIVFQVILALHQLDCLGLQHRDVKPQNILLDTQMNATLCDFGLSRLEIYPSRHMYKSHDVQTLWYRAPEILLGSTIYNSKVDVWSVGVIFWELMCLFLRDSKRRRFFHSFFEVDQILRIFKLCGKPKKENPLCCLPHWNKEYPNFLPAGIAYFPNFRNSGYLIQRILRLDPSERPSFRELLFNDFFRCEAAQFIREFNLLEKIKLPLIDIPNADLETVTPREYVETVSLLISVLFDVDITGTQCSREDLVQRFLSHTSLVVGTKYISWTLSIFKEFLFLSKTNEKHFQNSTIILVCLAIVSKLLFDEIDVCKVETLTFHDAKKCEEEILDTLGCALYRRTAFEEFCECDIEANETIFKELCVNFILLSCTKKSLKYTTLDHVSNLINISQGNILDISEEYLSDFKDVLFDKCDHFFGAIAED